MLDTEKYEYVKRLWEDTGDCDSCGWHSAFYEVEEDIIPEIYDVKSLDEDGGFWVSCHGDYNEDGDHRGTYLYPGKSLYD